MLTMPPPSAPLVTEPPSSVLTPPVLVPPELLLPLEELAAPDDAPPELLAPPPEEAVPPELLAAPPSSPPSAPPCGAEEQPRATRRVTREKPSDLRDSFTRGAGEQEGCRRGAALYRAARRAWTTRNHSSNAKDRADTVAGHATSSADRPWGAGVDRRGGVATRATGRITPCARRSAAPTTRSPRRPRPPRRRRSTPRGAPCASHPGCAARRRR